MLTKMNSQPSVLRPVLLALALGLTVIAMVPPATATECTYPSTRRIVVDITCCNYPSASVTKQNQVCCADGTWVNDGGPYCGSYSHCAY